MTNTYIVCYNNYWIIWEQPRLPRPLNTSSRYVMRENTLPNIVSGTDLSPHSSTIDVNYSQIMHRHIDGSGVYHHMCEETRQGANLGFGDFSK